MPLPSWALPLSCMLLLSMRPPPRKKALPWEAEEGASTYYPARVPGVLHAHSQLAVQVDDGVVDEGEDSQLELGLAGVAILDHAGVGVGNRAAEGRNRALKLVVVPAAAQA